MRKLISSLVIGSVCVMFAGCESMNNKYASSTSTQSSNPSVSVSVAEMEQAMPASQTVHFGFDSDKLAADEREALDQIAELMMSNPDSTVKVEGYTDVRGPHRYNQDLGFRRAKSVVAYLTEKGIDSHRFDVESYGPDKALDTAESEVAHARNRRVEVSMKADSQFS